MEIFKEITELKKSIQETDQIIDELISSLNSKQLILDKKDKEISYLKEEIKMNVEKIDKIIEDFNANN